MAFNRTVCCLTSRGVWAVFVITWSGLVSAAARGQEVIPPEPDVVGEPPGYEMVILRETRGTPSIPYINDRQQVVWSEVLRDEKGELQANIFLWEDGVITQLTDDSTYDQDPVINNHGTIVWHRGRNIPYDDLMIYEDGVARPLVRAPSVGGDGPVINDNGLIVWSHPTVYPTQEIVVYDGEEFRTLTDNGLVNLGIALNDLNDIVWTAYDFQAAPWVGTIMYHHDGITEALTPGKDQDQTPSINDLREMVWNDSPGLTLVYWNGSEPPVLVAYPGVGPRISNSGDIAFTRTGSDGFNRLWLYREVLYYLLPDFGYDVGAKTLNSRGEAVARAFNFQTGYRAILMLRKCEDLGTVPCTEDSDCDDELFCTVDACVCGFCSNEPALYGDLNEDGGVDLLDILCVVDAFAGGAGAECSASPDVARCSPDGIIDLYDILAVLDAFAGQDPCCSDGQ